jgi:hypothetical protein
MVNGEEKLESEGGSGEKSVSLNQGRKASLLM